MNLKKVAVGLAALATLGGTGAFAQSISIGAPAGVACGAAPCAGLANGTLVNEGLAPVYTDKWGAPLYAYPGTTANQILSEPAVLQTAPLLRPHRHWWNLDFFGHGIMLNRYARHTQTVNSLPACVETCPAPVVAPVCPAPQEPVIQSRYTNETQTVQRRVIKRRSCRRVIRRSSCQRRRHACD